MWLVISKYKTILYALLALCVFGLGFYTHAKITKPIVQIQTTTQIVEKIVKIETDKKQIDTKKETVIVTNPDGSKTETTKETSSTKEETASSTSHDTSTVINTRPAGDKYRLGLFASRKLTDVTSDPFKAPDWGISAGVRTYGIIWTDATYDVNSHDLTVGFSIQF